MRLANLCAGLLEEVALKSDDHQLFVGARFILDDKMRLRAKTAVLFGFRRVAVPQNLRHDALDAHRLVEVLVLELDKSFDAQGAVVVGFGDLKGRDRKSTRLNSSHVRISYAVFCLKKKN